MRIGQKGFTLVEIIVSLAIMTIVAGSVGAFIVAGNNSYLRGSKELTLQEEAQLTANQMIDLIIDVEKDIQFLDRTGAAVALDGTPAQDASYRHAIISRSHREFIFAMMWAGLPSLARMVSLRIMRTQRFLSHSGARIRRFQVGGSE